MPQLCSSDLDLVRELRAAGVLNDIDRRRLPAQHGTVVVACSDGERLPNILSHHWGLCAGGRACHHTPALNGGPLLIPENSRVRGAPDLREDLVLLKHIRQGCVMKGLPTIILVNHFPCGAGKEAGIGLIENLRLGLEAKVRVFDYLQPDFAKLDIPARIGRHVLSFLDIDYGNRQRTYRVGRREWMAWSGTSTQTQVA